MISRRNFLTSASVLAGGAAALKELALNAAEPNPTVDPGKTYPPGEAGKNYTPVVTPNGVALPWKIVDDVKVYHLVAEEVLHEFAPGLKAYCWGFNGRVHGPTIEAVEGDHVR